MTIPENEEALLIDLYVSAREAYERVRKEAIAIGLKKNGAEKYMNDAKQAIIDYANGNGILESENFTISKTTSIDVPDIDAVPEAFVRVKTVREPNKILIRGNWYQVVESDKLTLKAGE